MSIVKKSVPALAGAGTKKKSSKYDSASFYLKLSSYINILGIRCFYDTYGIPSGINFVDNLLLKWGDYQRWTSSELEEVNEYLTLFDEERLWKI